MHRILGRCYVIGVVVAATISLSITMLRNGLPLQIAVFTQASLWLLTTAVAFYCIRRRSSLSTGVALGRAPCEAEAATAMVVSASRPCAVGVDLIRMTQVGRPE